ncbi:aminotransferase class V-fold PLP-dependent enzyme [Actinokineospora globicatena]|uniref:aminotransferase class V-fold PLP-dependent enzyme n=1 Tax=Actinokineospora globicatena TaxID=103729 RepID=UPI0020A2AFBF|nr:aminotransferase class V-fold PLP-dependent enzyme [Actinokineospora globicatena]MCP2303964.1 Kynureninase [Actinokineospora globicatena]GLW78874.1 kynureninase [Actinokineospora globicatena]GLW86713.1 kynureninase [Actinokineospora globicatena]
MSALGDPISEWAGGFATGGLVHLNGNSLGPPRVDLTDRLAAVVTDQWTPGQVRAWFRDGWLDLPRTVGDKLAPLLGAAEGQVVIAGDTTSTTLFNALVAACRLRERPVLLIEAEAFPTDLYIAASVARLLGRELVVESRDGFDTYLGEHGDRVGVALAAPVDFRTGRRRDIGTTTALCHAVGALAVWDLCHAAGVLPTNLDTNDVDLAIGCGYKYLGGGPGAPAFLYVAARWQSEVDFPLAGWHGHADPFAMTPDFVPAAGIDRGRNGTPPLLSLVALDHALEPLVAVGIDELHRRTKELGEAFLAGLRPDIEVVSPRDPDQRGGHLALRVSDADAVEHGLAERDVLVDARPPDLIRVAFAPLYVTPEHVRTATEAIHSVLAPPN